MKKWSKPTLMNLGIDYTNDNPIETWASDNTNANHHYCHAQDGLVCNGKPNEHSSVNSNANKDHKFTGIACNDPNHSELNGNSSCCCVGLS